MSIEEIDPYWKPKSWESSSGRYKPMPLHPGIFMSPCEKNTWWNCTNQRVILGDLVIYFHYQHVMAFYTPTTGLRIAENWNHGSILGRVLNYISKDKNIRIKHEQVVEELAKYLREDFSF